MPQNEPSLSSQALGTRHQTLPLPMDIAALKTQLPLPLQSSTNVYSSLPLFLCLTFPNSNSKWSPDCLTSWDHVRYPHSSYKGCLNTKYLIFSASIMGDRLTAYHQLSRMSSLPAPRLIKSTVHLIFFSLLFWLKNY